MGSKILLWQKGGTSNTVSKVVVVCPAGNWGSFKLMAFQFCVYLFHKMELRWFTEGEVEKIQWHLKVGGDWL